MLAIDKIYFYSQDKPSAKKLFPKLRPTIVSSLTEVRYALEVSKWKTLWIARDVRPFAELLLTLLRTSATHRLAERVQLPSILLLGEARGYIDVLDQVFRKVLAPIDNKSFFLAPTEIEAALIAKNNSELVIAGTVDTQAGIIKLLKGDLSRVFVPISSFKPTSEVTPDFDRFEIIDHGHTLKFGAYEANIDAVLYENDPEYRKLVKKRLAASEKSFGASLRRLRLQKGLKQSDFEPELDERTIRRLEDSKERPARSSTMEILARKLEVSPDDIESY
jgi:DNA-binding Xre family transcriptional regulator